MQNVQINSVEKQIFLSASNACWSSFINMLGTEYRALNMLGNHSTIEIHPKVEHCVLIY